jgi:adenylate kinase
MVRKILILLGHPGAGKGTQAREIMHRLDIPQISTGDMLRDAIVRNTAHGREAKARMDSGELVSDDIVNGIVSERIQMEDCKNGFILDGYPRTVQQAETFRSLMSNDDRLVVIEIGANSEDLTNRLVGRLMCSGCGEIYNEYSRAPKQSGVCNFCGKELFRRSDDREDLIRERFKTYQEETYPLVQFYKDMGVYHHVEGMRLIKDITREILAIIDGYQDLTPVPTKGGNQSIA